MDPSDLLPWAPMAAIAATIGVGVLAVRRSRLGPEKTWAWRLDHARGQVYDLVLDGVPAHDVRIEVENGQLTGGQAEHGVLRPGQTAQLLITHAESDPPPTRVHVTWAGKRRRRETWSTDLDH